MKKRIGSLLLILALCFTLLPTAALAAENTQEPTEPQETQDTETWGDKADTSWYTSAPGASEYHISTAEQLAGLAQLVNTDPEPQILQGKLSIWIMTLIYLGMNGFRLVLSSAGITLNTVFAACLMDRAM